jgi:hypothetical protein
MEYLKYYKKDLKTYLRHLLSAPFIYSVFFAFIILDVFVEIYHRISFPLYWLELVDRKKYIKFDRHRLQYLDYIDRFNCLYCSYWNWLIHYVSEIAWRTEKYWCWIQHQKSEDFIPPKHHKDFLAYWDEKAFFREYSVEDKECKLLKD